MTRCPAWVFVAACACLWVGTSASSPATSPTGHDWIDMHRAQVIASPTDAGNAQERLAALYAWYRATMMRGWDRSAMDAVRDRIAFGVTGPDMFADIDRAYAIMEAIERDPQPIAEVLGPDASHDAPSNATDWPMMQRDAAHTSHSPDAGASKGVVAWSASLGTDFQPRAFSVEHELWLPSPGTQCVGLIVDEATGRVLRRIHRISSDFYGVPRASGDAWVIDGKWWLAMRSGDRVRRQLIEINPAQSLITRTQPAAPIEQRFGPLAQASGAMLAFTLPQRKGVLMRRLADGRTWWSYPLREVVGEPVLRGPSVYVAHADGVSALHREGPQRLAWQSKLDAPPTSEPAVAEKFVFVACADGGVVALDASAGSVRWRQHVADPDPRLRQTLTVPARWQGLLIVGDVHGHLHGLRETDGHIAWTVKLPEGVRARPVVAGDRMLVAGMDGSAMMFEMPQGDASSPPTLRHTSRISDFALMSDPVPTPSGWLVADVGLHWHALNHDGKPRWQRPMLDTIEAEGEHYEVDAIAGLYQSSPTVVDGTVFVATPSGFLDAFDAATGERRWRYELGGVISASPTVEGDTIYLGGWAGDGMFHAIDRRTGLPRWSTKTGGVWSTAICVNGKVFVGTLDGRILVLDASDGRQRASFQAGDGFYPTPLSDAERVYAGSWDGHYYALDAEHATPRWSYAPPGWPYHLGGRPDSASPTLIGQTLYVQVWGGFIDAVDVGTGKMRWRSELRQGMVNNGHTATDGQVLIGSWFRSALVLPMDATLVALDPDNGRERWTYPGAGGLTGPSLGRERLFCGSTTDPFFSALDLQGDAPPTLRFRLKLQGLVEEAAPAVYGVAVYFTASDGRLRCVR